MESRLKGAGHGSVHDQSPHSCCDRGVLKRDGVEIAQGTDVWSCIRAMLRPRSAEDLPFPGGVIGLASYEAGMRLERIASRHMSDEPELIAMLCDDFFAFDRLEKRLWWVSHSAAPVPEIPVVLDAEISQKGCTSG